MKDGDIKYLLTAYREAVDKMCRADPELSSTPDCPSFAALLESARQATGEHVNHIATCSRCTRLLNSIAKILKREDESAACSAPGIDPKENRASILPEGVEFLEVSKEDAAKAVRAVEEMGLVPEDLGSVEGQGEPRSTIDDTTLESAVKYALSISSQFRKESRMASIGSPDVSAFRRKYDLPMPIAIHIICAVRKLKIASSEERGFALFLQRLIAQVRSIEKRTFSQRKSRRNVHGEK